MNVNFVQVISTMSVGICIFCIIIYSMIYRFRRRTGVFYALSVILIVSIIGLTYNDVIEGYINDIL